MKQYQVITGPIGVAVKTMNALRATSKNMQVCGTAVFGVTYCATIEFETRQEGDPKLVGDYLLISVTTGQATNTLNAISVGAESMDVIDAKLHGNTYTATVLFVEKPEITEARLADELKKAETDALKKEIEQLTNSYNALLDNEADEDIIDMANGKLEALEKKLKELTE